MNRKKSFLIYFDSVLIMESLPPEQRGWLFSALCRYADRIWQDEGVTVEEILDLYPQLTQESRMACAFLATSIQRDTRRWLDQTRRRQEAALTRSAPIPSSPSPAELLHYRQDAAHAQRALDQMREDAMRLVSG